jgi:hypothetical protein
MLTRLRQIDHLMAFRASWQFNTAYCDCDNFTYTFKYIDHFSVSATLKEALEFQ